MSRRDEINEFFKTVTIDSSTRVKSDNALQKQDMDSMAKHSRDYDALLSAYTSYVADTLKAKKTMKIIFYIVSLSILIASSGLVGWCASFAITSIQMEKFEYIDYLIPCLTSFLSFLTIIIVIPKIIAKYLFNSHEENIMKDVVSSIQTYDKQIWKGLNK